MDVVDHRVWVECRVSACVGVLWRSDQQPHFNASSEEDEGFGDEMQLKSEIDVSKRSRLLKERVL